MVCKNITCLNAIYRNSGGYCAEHQQQRAEAAEVAAAESAAFARGLQSELKAAEADCDEAIKRANAAEYRTAQAEAESIETGKAYAAKAHTVTELQRIIDELIAERDNAIKRAEAAEAELKETAKAYISAEARSAELERYLDLANAHAARLMQERDELRRQLSEAQHAIDVLSQTIIAQNNEIKRLEQAREDVTEYRAEIARLNQAATA